MKKRLVIFGIILIMVFSLTACGIKETPANRIERRYGIELPKEMTYAYDYYTVTFQGEVTSYTVFKLKEEPAEFLSEHSFNERLSTASEKELESDLDDNKSAVGGISGIPKEYYPDWSSEYLSKRISYSNGVDNGYMLYFPDTLKLIFYIRSEFYIYT